MYTVLNGQSDLNDHDVGVVFDDHADVVIIHLGVCSPTK